MINRNLIIAGEEATEHDVIRDMCDYLRFDLPENRIDGFHVLTMYSHNNIRLEFWLKMGLAEIYDEDFDERAERKVVTIYLTQRGRDLVTLEIL